MERIDPENPSTVPNKYRQRMIDAATRIAGPTAPEEMQMLTDLLALAVNDGCVAAGWAFDLLAPEVPQ